MGIDEWSRYAELIEMSEAQRKAAEAAYDDYRRVDWQFRMDRAQPLWERSAVISAWGAIAHDVEAAASLCSLFDEAHALHSAIAAIEGRLFTELAPLLAPQQLVHVAVARLWRERLRAQEITSPLPGYTFDLDEVLLNVAGRGTDCTPRDQATFDGLMSAWRQGATGLHRRYAEAQHKALSESTLYPARVNQMLAAAGGMTPEVSAFAEEHRRLGTAIAEIARKLLEFNEQYVNLVAAELPESSSVEIRAQFDKLVYRALFPDPADMTVIFEAVGRLTLSAQQRADLEAARVDCESANSRALDRMKQRYIAWSEQTCARRGYLRDDHALYATEMQDLEQSRIDKCHSTIAIITATLSPEQGRAIQGAIDLWHGWLDGFKARQRHAIEKFKGWPGPYD